MFHKGRYLLVSIMFVLIMSIVAGCDYVGPTNIHRNLSSTDYELLAHAAPLTNYQMDYSINSSLTINDTGLTFHMTGDGALTQSEDTLLPGIEFNLEGTITADDGRTGYFAIYLRFLNDGGMYMKVDELNTNTSTGWMVIELDKALDALEFDLDDPASSEILQGDDIESMVQAADDFGVYKFTTIETLGEEQLNGVDTRHFLIQVNYLELLTSPDFATFLTQTLATGGGLLPKNILADVGLSLEQLQYLVPLMDIVVPALFPRFDLQVDQFVGIADGYQRQSITRFNLDIDLSSLTDLLAFTVEEAEAEMLNQPVHFFFYMTTSYRDYGEPYEIIAPEQAEPIDIADWLAGEN